ncbi:MAG: molybdopterin molybdotransferase MoeA [Oscillospiraceae bacterium]|nr:molybdopterin molybdotransferase MoeA [Oscillospiraceae bacterium]
MLNVKTPEETLRLIEESFRPLERTETVPLERALGRVLAADIEAAEYVPGFDRSTVDGYALRAADSFGCSDAVPAVLRLTGEVRMGEGAAFTLDPGCCAAVPTGGAIPGGADCAVMLEHAEVYGDGTVGVLRPAAPGENLIFRGDDVFPGKTVLRAGRVLAPQDIGVLAALGVSAAPVRPRLRVGLISTGDELLPADRTPGPGQVRDVNGPMLAALLRDFGAEPADFGIVPDEEALLRKTAVAALADCDALILSGGSSAGSKDAACRVVEGLGELLLHGVAVKPGKPTILGRAGSKPLVGLPGHPAAAFFMAKLFVLPLLARLEGRTLRSRPLRAHLSESLGANHGRAQINPCRLEETEDGLLAVPVRSKSGLITQVAGADGYLVIARDCEGLPKGGETDVFLL